MKASLYWENHNGYYEDEYVQLEFENRAKPLRTKFTISDFQEWVRPEKAVTIDGRVFIPIINCSCGYFECGGSYTEYIDNGDTITLKVFYGRYDIEEEQNIIEDDDIVLTTRKFSFLKEIKKLHNAPVLSIAKMVTPTK